ncbi:MAG: transaldolase [Alphaproteobacteria bacterium]
MQSIEQIPVEIYLDGASLEDMEAFAPQSWIKGFTTNPSLMKSAGVQDYEGFAKKTLEAFPNHPISFEVFADDPQGMLAQARKIATWGKNVFVKIPVINTKGQSMAAVIRELSKEGVALNITAIFTTEQVQEVADSLSPNAPALVSVFAGRIADTGRDPVPLMQQSLAAIKHLPLAKLLWASTREFYNIVQAANMGCHVITVPKSVLKHAPNVGKDLAEYSQDTVKAFYKDAQDAGFKL